MNEETTRKELLKLERQYWTAVKDRDVEAALKLTDTPCIIAGARGVASVEREAFIDIMQGATYKLHNFDIKDGAQVRFLTDDIAVIAYTVHENLTVDGKPVSMEASDASIWIRRDDGWRCAVHTEALHGDPYGRDRAPQ